MQMSFPPDNNHENQPRGGFEMPPFERDPFLPGEVVVASTYYLAEGEGQDPQLRARLQMGTVVSTAEDGSSAEFAPWGTSDLLPSSADDTPHSLHVATHRLYRLEELKSLISSHPELSGKRITDIFDGTDQEATDAVLELLGASFEGEADSGEAREQIGYQISLGTPSPEQLVPATKVYFLLAYDEPGYDSPPTALHSGSVESVNDTDGTVNIEVLDGKTIGWDKDALSGNSYHIDNMNPHELFTADQVEEILEYDGYSGQSSGESFIASPSSDEARDFADHLENLISARLRGDGELLISGQHPDQRESASDGWFPETDSFGIPRNPLSTAEIDARSPEEMIPRQRVLIPIAETPRQDGQDTPGIVVGTILGISIKDGNSFAHVLAWKDPDIEPNDVNDGELTVAKMHEYFTEDDAAAIIEGLSEFKGLTISDILREPGSDRFNLLVALLNNESRKRKIAENISSGLGDDKPEGESHDYTILVKTLRKLAGEGHEWPQNEVSGTRPDKNRFKLYADYIPPAVDDISTN